MFERELYLVNRERPRPCDLPHDYGVADNIDGEVHLADELLGIAIHEFLDWNEPEGRQPLSDEGEKAEPPLLPIGELVDPSELLLPDCEFHGIVVRLFQLAFTGLLPPFLLAG